MSIWACLQVDVVAWALERRVVAGHRHGMRVACDHVYTKSIDTRHVHAVVMLAVRIWAACIVRMHLHRYEPDRKTTWFTARSAWFGTSCRRLEHAGQLLTATCANCRSLEQGREACADLTCSRKQQAWDIYCGRESL
eukprot:s1441_g3.t1